MTEPSGAMFPCGNVTVLVSPRARAFGGDMITSSASTPSRSLSNSRRRVRRSERSHHSRTSPSRLPLAVRASSRNRPSVRRCSITSGTPPARNRRIVGWPTGPLGRTSTNRGTARFTRLQSSTVGRRRPASKATAGMCSNKLVEPPHAACTASAFSSASSVSMSRVAIFSRASATTARGLPRSGQPDRLT